MESCSNSHHLLNQPLSSASLHFLLTGTFNTIFLYLLTFNPVTLNLAIVAKIKGQGPHQFLALNAQRDKCYATTWSSSPSLSAWNVIDHGRGGIERINTVPITATSSYIQVSPESNMIYSAGGPTGEVHSLDANTGGFASKLQELLYVEPEELEQADKTRVALRYGSHGIDLSLPTRQAFVPHLGTNSIYMYNILEDGTLRLIAKQISFGEGSDGPRHVIPSGDGRILYVITEHTSFVDVYEIYPTSLKHLQRVSVMPENANRHSYRGDTLRFSRDRMYLYATTRGMTAATRGYVAVWSVDPVTNLLGESPLSYYQTRTSGGKANAIETFPFERRANESISDWMVLTDDEQGWVSILEWDGVRMEEIAAVQLGVDEEGEEKGVGASHAVWLS